MHFYAAETMYTLTYELTPNKMASQLWAKPQIKLTDRADDAGVAHGVWRAEDIQQGQVLEASVRHLRRKMGHVHIAESRVGRVQSLMATAPRSQLGMVVFSRRSEYFRPRWTRAGAEYGRVGASAGSASHGAFAFVGHLSPSRCFLDEGYLVYGEKTEVYCNIRCFTASTQLSSV